MLNWSERFSILLLLDSNGYVDKYSKYEYLLAAGAEEIVPATDMAVVKKLHDTHHDWLFGHIAYDYKNKLEKNLASLHADNIGFEDLVFFRPQVVCYFSTGSTDLVIESIADHPDEIYALIIASDDVSNKNPAITFTARTTKEKYLHTVERLRAHIKDGDCYEINYCNEYYAENVKVAPPDIFMALNKVSRAPFAAYYKLNNKYLVCASPERYLQKNGRTITSQPIKGTAARCINEAEDEIAKISLLNSIKERAENVMITDLVRNDLARSCITGSVIVEELFGIYTFPQVHQMITTISGRIDEAKHFTDAIKLSFPMGSMTGAPKIKVMQLIEHYEDARRGLFSGTVGYISPDGDFDFNVVIRSLFYNEARLYLSFFAGGAITYDSDPNAEWEEMRLKGRAMEKLFSVE